MDNGTVTADIYLENGYVTFIAVIHVENDATTLTNAIEDAILGNGDDIENINDSITADKGLESVELEGTVLTLNVSKDVNGSGIVTELTSRLSSVLGQIENVRFNGKDYTAEEFSDLLSAVKTAVNDAIPEATDKAQTGDESWTVKLTMKDETVINYTLIVEWNVAADA